MEDIFNEIKRKTTLRKVAGLSLVILGFLLYLIPLLPGTWAIVLGLEILGVRFLVQDKLKEHAHRSKLLQKILHKK